MMMMMNDLWSNETTSSSATTAPPSLSSSFLAREETTLQDMLFVNCSRPGNPSHEHASTSVETQYVWFHLGFISSKFGSKTFWLVLL